MYGKMIPLVPHIQYVELGEDFAMITFMFSLPLFLNRFLYLQYFVYEIKLFIPYMSVLCACVQSINQYDIKPLINYI